MVPNGKGRVVAARLAGTFKTAFPKGPDGTNDVSKALSEGKGSVMLVADTDFLADDFCVRIIKTPFGQIPQLINENLTLFANVIEQFAGNEDLIGVRSRGASDRPFTKVNELEAMEMMTRFDRQRRTYHNYYCEGKWGDSRNYDLCVNSSTLGVEGSVELILRYLELVREAGR